eukprot:CAMPEP_0202476076 /NCGR_PEP_ID=MMETSP1360-20130828/93231_1 /ASSEMBLY_ACC=CAM_ASM_000848 /TAXON_ID=515479 /ORGANISM="Licmophora paradoxa, Strain CCMP2313" /LENGTH=864 /DNA_ID=CAMNT_0049103265 /DNA_START=268 /DNA_END=2862 /DNA_ORIENTATION=-
MPLGDEIFSAQLLPFSVSLLINIINNNNINNNKRNLLSAAAAILCIFAHQHHQQQQHQQQQANDTNISSSDNNNNIDQTHTHNTATSIEEDAIAALSSMMNMTENSKNNATVDTNTSKSSPPSSIHSLQRVLVDRMNVLRRHIHLVEQEAFSTLELEHTDLAPSVGLPVNSSRHQIVQLLRSGNVTTSHLLPNPSLASFGFYCLSESLLWNKDGEEPVAIVPFLCQTHQLMAPLSPNALNKTTVDNINDTDLTAWVLRYDPDEPNQMIPAQNGIENADYHDIGKSLGDERLTNTANLEVATKDIHMELHDWSLSVLSIQAAEPSQELITMLSTADGWSTIILAVLENAISRMTDGNDTTVLSLDGTKLVSPNFDSQNPDHTMCVALVSLYWHALECILRVEKQRRKSLEFMLVKSNAFHRALLACCYVSLLKAFGETRRLVLTRRHRELDIFGAIIVMDSTPYTYLKVSESFVRALKIVPKQILTGSVTKNAITDGLPTILQKYMGHCEVLVLDSLIWSRDDSIAAEGCVIDVIRDIIVAKTEDGTMSCWPPEVLLPTLEEEKLDANSAGDKFLEQRLQKKIPSPTPEQNFVSYLLRKLLKIVYFRLSSLCSILQIPLTTPVASQTWIAFRYLLRREIQLLYDRHVDQLLLCALYGVTKIIRYEPEVTFGRIIEAYTACRGMELGEKNCTRVVRHIRLIREEDGMQVPKSQKKDYGNIIHLYNQVFVTAMKNHLLQSESLKQASAEMQILNEARKKEESKKDVGVLSTHSKIPENFRTIHDGNLVISFSSPRKKRKTATPSLSSSAKSSRSRAVYTFGNPDRHVLDLANRLVMAEEEDIKETDITTTVEASGKLAMVSTEMVAV